MSDAARHDAWQAGDAYDRYMGRWSRQIAPAFLAWLDAPLGADWLDVGCGTGALTAAIVAAGAPATVLSLDPSAGFLAQARKTVNDPRVTFQTADAQALPIRAGTRDVVVSGLVLNFVPDRARALAEMRRVARSGARIGFYVWDYPGGGLELLRAFWNAATSLDPNVADLGEARRFPFCTPDGLRDLATAAGLDTVDVTAITMPSVFRDFDDYWLPFTLGAGPAPGYCAGLPTDARDRLRARLDATLPRQADGSIVLQTRAWALKARIP